MFAFIERLISQPKEIENLSEEYVDFAQNSYPSNHTFRIANKKLIPKRQLANRYEKIAKLLPENLTSFADISCSKGFFVFESSNFPNCTRSLGIDVSTYNIQFCQAIKKYLKNSVTQFELLQLHELSERIDEFGGPFQTIILANAYQYLYFGSRPHPECYSDHDLIFKYLRQICSDRIIFTNRVNLEDVQKSQCFERHSETIRQNYSEKNIVSAISKYFTIEEHGKSGRWPLWLLKVKS